jgi:trimeric autotransporter adhesin
LQNNTGVNNTAIGYQAMDAAGCSGSSNAAIGYGALSANTTGYGNVALGYYALTDNLGGYNNVGLGRESLKGNTTGNNNTAIGWKTGQTAAVGANNCIYIGYQAGESNTASNIVAIGYQALMNNTGSGNTAIGYQTMDAVVTGSYNVAIGYSALGSNTSGERNVTIGYQALYDNTSGKYNTAMGFYAGENATATIDGCVYLGYSAGQNNTTANTLYINNSNSAYPLVFGNFATDTLSFGDNNAYFFAHILHDNTGGVLHLKEASDKPTAKADFGCIWTEADNTLHFMDGAGTEYTVDLTPV